MQAPSAPGHHRASSLSSSAAASARTHEILDSIREVFMAKGFEGASMQTLARAAGMSAGNFYLYFSSKAAIIEAMIERDLSLMQANFDSVRVAADPRGRFRELLVEHIVGANCASAPMMPEIESAALHNPDVAVLLRRFETAVQTNMAGLLAQLAGVPDQASSPRFVVHARTIMILVGGVMSVQRLACEADRQRDAELAAHLTGLIDGFVDAATNANLSASASNRLSP